MTATGVDDGIVRARVRRTFARLSLTGELPALPAAAAAALALARDPNSDFEALTRLVRADAGLAARILRVANSLVYARRTPARTLPDAIGTIGLRKTCDLLVVAFTVQLYRDADPVVRTLWDHALLSAIAAEELARRTNGADPAAAFLPGLFHDVGLLVFLLAEPTAGPLIGRLLDTEADGEEEVQRFGFTHAEAGAVLAGDWGLDVLQVAAIRWHHEPARARAGQGLAALLAAADRLARAVRHGEEGPAAFAVDAVLPALCADDAARCAARVRELHAEHSALLL
jgi:HD-like signal output (HDOD) protein